MGSQQDILQATQATTRLLLALWDLGATEQEVAKGQLTKRIVAKGKKVSDFQDIFAELQDQGAIAISKKGYTLSLKGKEVLSAGLRSADFKFEGTIVGSWIANALVKWISKSDVAVAATGVGVKSEAIATYDEFKSVALEVYDKLNRDYNLDDLVPIYRIRREIGDRVSREYFSAWLLEMQENDILQLQGGSLSDSDPGKLEDSITTPISGLRCYAKRLNS